ncbi:lytic polysaccharide monooxygenase [Streptomyces sp. NPDC001922]|uniref:lytic polysaccharide monooxygenase n=1 Tax=Streptomyces sp. NPDC001922 TaxID=3364624 RepID=UPI00368B0242
MTVHRNAAVAALVGGVPLLMTAVTAGPAAAHGAPTDPVSRAAACSPVGEEAARSAACAAAVKANGGRLFEDWDNLRVADVRGRDRQRIPDGALCSAGLDGYRGLDIARSDWPATTLKAGDDFTLTYRSTIPHQGSFSLYLTKDGYDPSTPLTWDDLERKPFLTSRDPQLDGDAYHLRGKLPASTTGRHVLYTVWRNTDTPDTYYSCSDVVLKGGAGAAGAGTGREAAGADEGSPGAADSRPAEDARGGRSSRAAASTGSGADSRQAADRQESAPAQPAAADSSSTPVSPLMAGVAGAVLAVAAAVVFAVVRRRPF